MTELCGYHLVDVSHQLPVDLHLLYDFGLDSQQVESKVYVVITHLFNSLCAVTSRVLDRLDHLEHLELPPINVCLLQVCSPVKPNHQPWLCSDTAAA